MKEDVAYRILGVDPGTNFLGYGLIDVRDKKLILLEMGVVHLQKYRTHHLKLEHIFSRIQQIIISHRPHAMAIEAPFFGKNVQSMLKLGRAQGVAIAAGITNGLTVSEYAPKKIKLSVTGNGNASKEQVAAMLKHLLCNNIPNTELDATDAVATAVCHFYQRGSIKGAKRKYSGWKDYLQENPGKTTKS